MHTKLFLLGLLSLLAGGVGAQPVPRPSAPLAMPGSAAQDAAGPREAMPEAGRGERRAALREALKPPREPQGDDSHPDSHRRPLSPDERAQLRQQLRQQPPPSRRAP